MMLIRKYFNCLVSTSIMFVFLLYGCSTLEDVNELDVCDTPIEYRVAAVEQTKASITTNDNVVSFFPEMYVAAYEKLPSDDADYKTARYPSLFTTTFDTATLKPDLDFYWSDTSSDCIFVSWPNRDDVSPSGMRISYNQVKFDYTVGADATSTPDVVFAASTVSNGTKTVDFTYYHIFTAVKVKYNKLKSAHKITKIQIVDTYSTGCFKVNTAPNHFEVDRSKFSSTTDSDKKKYQNKITIKDENIRYVTETSGQTLTEDGSVFMTIPGQHVKLEVYIDGQTEPFKAEYTENTLPGQCITFVIHDDWTITQEDGIDVETGVEQTNGTYKMVLEAWVNGEAVRTKTPNTVLVVDASESMGHNYTYLGTVAKSSNDSGKDLSFLDKSKGTDGYYYLIDDDGDVWKHVRYNSGAWQAKYRDSGSWYNIITEVSRKYTCIFVMKSGNSKLKILQNAFVEFVNQAYSMGDTHYITVVSFADNGSVVSTRKDVMDSKDAIINAINDIGSEDGGGTNSDYGFEEILDEKLLYDDLNTYSNTVIFGTGGYLTGGVSYNSTRQNAVKYSNYCKTTYTVSGGWFSSSTTYTYNASVYTIGVCVDKYANLYSQNKDEIKAYLERTSSNYSGATSYNNGTLSSSGYYLSSDSESSITSFAGGIVQKIEDKITVNNLFFNGLDKNSYVNACVSGAFKQGVFSNISFYKAKQKGCNPYSWDSNQAMLQGMSYDVDNTRNGIVNIKGFDFTSMYCGKRRNGKGYKFIIEINGLQKNTDLNGTGKNIANGYKSGLYKSDGTLVYEFEPIYVSL